MFADLTKTARQRRLKALEALTLIKSRESDEFRQLRRRGLARAFSRARLRSFNRSSGSRQGEMNLLAA